MINQDYEEYLIPIKVSFRLSNKQMDDLDKLLETYLSTLLQDNSPEEPPKSYSFMSRSKSMCRLQGKIYGV